MDNKLIEIILQQSTSHFIKSNIYDEIFCNILIYLKQMYYQYSIIIKFIHFGGLDEALNISISRNKNIMELIMEWFDISNYYYYGTSQKIYSCTDLEILNVLRKYRYFKTLLLEEIIIECIKKNNILFLDWLVDVMHIKLNHKNKLTYSCDYMLVNKYSNINFNNIEFYFQVNIFDNNNNIYDWLTKYIPIKCKTLRERALNEGNINIFKWLSKYYSKKTLQRYITGRLWNSAIIWKRFDQITRNNFINFCFDKNIVILTNE